MIIKLLKNTTVRTETSSLNIFKQLLFVHRQFMFGVVNNNIIIVQVIFIRLRRLRSSPYPVRNDPGLNEKYTIN